MVSNPFSGVFYLFRGAKLLAAPGVKRFVIVPLIINIVLFAGLIFLGVNQFETLINWLMPELPEWLQWLAWLMWAVFVLAVLIIVFYTFTIIANIISSPFNSALAEAVEIHITGRKLDTPPSVGSAMKNIGSAFKQEMIKLRYMALRAIPLLILFLIPGVNIAAPFIWAIFCAWLLALEYADYPMGNHDVPFTGVRERLKKKRVMSLGFGGATTVATLIPFVNFFVIPAAVAGATLMWVEQHAENTP